MKTTRSLRILDTNPRHRPKKEPNSPTLASSYSQKQLWAKSFKNEPFPSELKRRLIGHKFKFSDFSDEEEDNSGVVVQEQETEVLQKKKILPLFKLISDNGEFLASRNRIKSAQKFFSHSPRCKSVESLRLPQVMEEKKEEDELHKLELSKLSQFTDKNEFGQRSLRYSENNSIHAQQKDSLEPNAFRQGLPERIIENDAEQTKSVKLKNQRSILDDELDKLIVDEMDEKKKKKEDPQIEEIIEEERNQEDTEGVNRLRVSLERFQQEAQFLNKFKDEQLKISHNNSDNSESSHRSGHKGKPLKQQRQHEETITQIQGLEEYNNL